MKMTEQLFLYVDDDAMSRQVMQLLVEDLLEPTRLISWADSRDFLGRCRGLPRKPDMIFLDIHIKPISGFEMLALLRSEAGLADARVVAVTASVMNEEILRLQQAGFDALISKPLDAAFFPRLLARIQRGEHVWYIG